MGQVVTDETSGTAPDPLAGYYDVPIISVPQPGQTYVGRVILELWESPGSDDANSLVMMGQPALIQRVAQALPVRLARQPKLFTNS